MKKVLYKNKMLGYEIPCPSIDDLENQLQEFKLFSGVWEELKTTHH